MPWEPDWVIRPGETVQEELEERGMTAADLATACDVDLSVIEGLFAGTQPITDDLAEALHDVFGVSTAFWLNLERRYREGLAAGKKELE